MAQMSAAPTSPCCSTESQATCCEPADKAACCGAGAAGGSCGCSAGRPDDIRERYAAAVPAECRLDTGGASRQLERYRALARHVMAAERGPGRLAVRFDAGYDAAVLHEAVDVERNCCPFLTLEPRVEERELIVSVAASEHDPALDAIADALGVVYASRG